MTTLNSSPNSTFCVVEAYRLDRYDNTVSLSFRRSTVVVEAYRLDRYDNTDIRRDSDVFTRCRSLSFG